MTEIENLNLDFDPITGKLRKKKDGVSSTSSDDEGKPVFKVAKNEDKKTEVSEPKKDKELVLSNEKSDPNNNASGTPQPQKNSSQQPIKNNNTSPTNDYKDQFGNKLDGFNSYVDQGSLYSFSNTDNSTGYSDKDFRSVMSMSSFSGKNIIGDTVSKIASYFSKLNVHEVAKNVVSNNLADASAELGVNIRRGGDDGSWCADYGTFLLRKTLSVVDPNFSEKDFKKYPGSSGALVLRDKFADHGAYVSKENFNINKIDPESLVGAFLFYERGNNPKEYKGHVRVVEAVDVDKNGKIFLTISGGNESNRIVTKRVSLEDMISGKDSDGHSSLKFKGFGDLGKVIEDVNPTLSVYLKNKNNLKDQEYALDNKSTAKTRSKSSSHSIEG